MCSKHLAALLVYKNFIHGHTCDNDTFKILSLQYYEAIYHSLVKECPWEEHLTKMGVGALSSVSTFNHKKVPMSCSQRLCALNHLYAKFIGI